MPTENHPNKTFYDRISRYYDGIAHASERKATEDSAPDTAWLPLPGR